MHPRSILVACQCTESDLAPARPAWIDQFKLDRRDSKQGDHGRLLRISLYAVVVRGAGDAVHEAPRGYRNGIVGSNDAPLFTHHVPDRTSESRSVA